MKKIQQYAWLPRFLKKRVRILFYYSISKISGRHYWVHGGVKLGFITTYHHEVAREMGTDFNEDPPEYFDQWTAAARHAEHIYDVGGYNGLYGIAAALANPHATVTIFEPDSINAQQCRSNIVLNGVQDRCKVSEVAVSGEAGESTFAMRGMTGGRLGEGESKVKCITLDDLPPPNLLKLDVEGQETAILTHAPKTLTHPMTIFMELHRWAPDKEKLWDAVRAFTVHEFDDRHYTLSLKNR